MSHSLCLETDNKQETPDPHESKAGHFTEQLKRRFLAEHLPEVTDGPQGEAEIKILMNTNISHSVSAGRDGRRGRVVNIFLVLLQVVTLSHGVRYKIKFPGSPATLSLALFTSI